MNGFISILLVVVSAIFAICNFFSTSQLFLDACFPFESGLEKEIESYPPEGIFLKVGTSKLPSKYNSAKIEIVNSFQKQLQQHYFVSCLNGDISNVTLNRGLEAHKIKFPLHIRKPEKLSQQGHNDFLFCMLFQIPSPPWNFLKVKSHFFNSLRGFYKNIALGTSNKAQSI